MELQNVHPLCAESRGLFLMGYVPVAGGWGVSDIILVGRKALTYKVSSHHFREIIRDMLQNIAACDNWLVVSFG